jgi:hypothetical protein
LIARVTRTARRVAAKQGCLHRDYFGRVSRLAGALLRARALGGSAPARGGHDLWQMPADIRGLVLEIANDGTPCCEKLGQRIELLLKPPKRILAQPVIPIPIDRLNPIEVHVMVSASKVPRLVTERIKQISAPDDLVDLDQLRRRIRPAMLMANQTANLDPDPVLIIVRPDLKPVPDDDRDLIEHECLKQSDPPRRSPGSGSPRTLASDASAQLPSYTHDHPGGRRDGHAVGLHPIPDARGNLDDGATTHATPA